MIWGKWLACDWVGTDLDLIFSKGFLVNNIVIKAL
jgi:hypothetical protein